MVRSSDLQYLTKEEVSKLASSIDNNRDKIIFDLFYETGCTLRELTELKKKDFDFSNNKLKIIAENTKSHKPRTIRISLKLTKKVFIFSQKNHTKNLFESRQSGKITERRIQQILSFYSRKSLAKKVSPHDIRVTHIIHSFLDDKPISEIEKEVGVNSIQPYIYSYFKSKK